MTDAVPSGSRIVSLQRGRAYALANRPGTYVLVQFDDAESGTVMESGSDALLTVKLVDLKPLHTSANTRQYDLRTLDEETKKRLGEQLEAIKPLLRFHRIPRKELVDQAAKHGVSPKTLRKWIRNYRRDPRLSSLGRKRRDDANKSRFDDVIEKELMGAIKRLLADGNLTLKTAHEDLITDLKAAAKRLGWKKWKAPSYGTLYNRYRSLSEKDKAEAKFGSRPARLKYGVSRGSMSDIDHPLCLVQVDHLEIPVVIVDELDRFPIQKAWITVLIDIFSRCVYGFYLTLESPGDLSLGLAMSHAILPKDSSLTLLDFTASWPISGFAWAIHADNAGEFHGNMLELAAQEYGFELLFRKVREPNYGGHIESYLGTLSEKLRQLPGSTRVGPESLGETNPEESAAMTLSELHRYILALIVEYHGTPHSGLNGMTPLAKFSEGMRGAPGVLPVGELWQAEDPERLKIDFLPCESRTVQPRGIQWDHIHYVDDCLQRWVHSKDPKNISDKRQFLVRRDPRDITRIYFLDPELNVYRVIPTRNLSRPSLSLWELRGTIAWLKQQGKTQIDEEMIFAARAMRRTLVARSQSATRSAQRQRARQRQRERDWKKGASTPAPEAAAVVETQAASPPPSGTAEVTKAAKVVGKPIKGGW